MARPKTDPKVRAQALRRLRAGESARTVADDLGVSPTAVRNWLKHDAPAAPAVAPATPAFDIHEVHDAAPPPSGTADELDAEAYARAMRAAATDDAPPASGTPTDGPAAPGAGTPPETVVDLFEGAVGLCLRLVVVGKGGDWTPQLENACRFTPSERNRLLVTAPYVAQYVGDALRSSPYVGIALFGMSALEVVTARLALVKAAAPARRLPNNRTTPPPAAQVDDDEEDLEPFPQTASPGVALVDFKANLGE
jgi:hypothetical protein